jgi:hypothetical protein
VPPEDNASDEPRTTKRRKARAASVAPPARVVAPRAAVRRIAAETQPASPRRKAFFGCKLPKKNPVNSSYYGEGAAVIRCVD